MSEIMTIEELYKRFPSEWVLIDEVQADEHYQVLGGRVVYHGRERDEIYNKGGEFNLKGFAIRYTGETPENVIFVI
jgi:hypothetical protein